MTQRMNEDGKKNQDVIAYFSMEIGISHSIPTYSGGLGILAGDLLKSYADLKIPVVGMTLLNEKGYFHQKIDAEGNQIEQPVRWNPSDFLEMLDQIISVEIEGRTVKIRPWKLTIKGGSGGHDIPVFFLDSNIEGNSAQDRTLTFNLYGGDRAYRLSQEIILGIGGVRMLEKLGYKVRKYHLNEGHASLLVAELVNMTGAGSESLDDIKNKCVFTTHTPVAAGHDQFESSLFRKITGNSVPEFMINEAMHDGSVNMTMFALKHSNFVNGVAKRHGEVTKEMFPGYTINAITNGVHHATWTCFHFRELFTKYIPEWRCDPFSLRYAFSIPDNDVWDAHQNAKALLIDEVNAKTNAGFRVSRFTIGYARRFTAYKRPDLILLDLERLKRIANSVGDIQIVFAGKAHSQDFGGKDLIKKVFQTAQKINAENGHLKIVFLERYDMKLAKLLVSGCDVWLNTPQRPLEASGTSGMKAAMNGVPQLSVLDGWWLEGHIDGVTGWSIGPHPKDPGFSNDFGPNDEADDLYTKLEKEILPLYYKNRDAWVKIMKQCIAINGSFFNTHRMAEQYIANAYLS